jgi:hypothetical protein
MRTRCYGRLIGAAFLAALAFATAARAAEFGSPGGPLPSNLDEISSLLRQDPYDLELLLVFGTGPGAAAGHLALAVRDGAPGDDRVVTPGRAANRVPRMTYLYGTVAPAPGAVFGEDFGVAYRRSVIGVRVQGVPAGERDRLVAAFAAGEGPAARDGSPTAAAMKLIAQWGASGHRIDAVHYRKYRGSNYFDPNEAEKSAFMYLPDRFPDVRSRTFARGHDRYRDEENLRAMYLLYHVGRYAVGVDGEKKRLAPERRLQTLPYAEATKRAAEFARSDADRFRRQGDASPEGRGYDERPEGDAGGMPDSAPC